MSECLGEPSVEGMERGGVAANARISSCRPLQHRRSKSASDRNLDYAKQGTPRCMEKECTESQNLVHLVRYEAQCSFYQDGSGSSNNASSDDQVSLQNDIKLLQKHLHREKTTRYMLERAIGRVSSTLSPGHRHISSKTGELISEIELLEKDIAEREQHVLSLYRTIFDQCVSGPSSVISSSTASPAHRKTEVRKQPNIISSAFCSSKKFRLLPCEVLASIKEAKPKSKHESLFKGSSNIQVESNSSDHMKLPTAGRSYLTRTLKEHLYQCPSKLSEEMIQCMAAIYSWFHIRASPESEKAHSAFLSRSSTSVVIPRRSAGEEQEWPCRTMIEISSILMDENHISHASHAIQNYRLLVEQLERVDASTMESNAKLAFWINVYNSLVMHAYLTYGIPHNSLRRTALFHKAVYKIGGYIVTANSIEHSLLCCRTPRNGRWFETMFSTAMRKKSGDEKRLLDSKFRLFGSQPLVMFALCTGAASDPLLRVYTAKNIMEELDKAKKDFLQANVVVKKSKKIFLPKILDRFAKEASLNYDNLLKWVSENVDKKLHEAIQKCIDMKNKRKASQVIEWLAYNTRFRYMFGKELTV